MTLESEDGVGKYPIEVVLPVQWGDMDSFSHVNNTGSLVANPEIDIFSSNNVPALVSTFSQFSMMASLIAISAEAL